MHAAWMRPQTAHFMQAALDDKGKVTGWRHRIVGEATTGYSQPARLEQAKGLDPLTLEGAERSVRVRQFLDRISARNPRHRACGLAGDRIGLQQVRDRRLRRRNRTAAGCRSGRVQAADAGETSPRTPDHRDGGRDVELEEASPRSAGPSISLMPISGTSRRPVPPKSRSIATAGRSRSTASGPRLIPASLSIPMSWSSNARAT